MAGDSRITEVMGDRTIPITAAALVILALILLGGISVAFSGSVQF